MLVLWWMRVKVYMQEGLNQAKEWQGGNDRLDDMTPPRSFAH